MAQRAIRIASESGAIRPQSGQPKTAYRGFVVHACPRQAEARCRKPAQHLTRGACWVRSGDGPSAIGNALGNSIVGQIAAPPQGNAPSSIPTVPRAPGSDNDFGFPNATTPTPQDVLNNFGNPPGVVTTAATFGFGDTGGGGGLDGLTPSRANFGNSFVSYLNEPGADLIAGAAPTDLGAINISGNVPQSAQLIIETEANAAGGGASSGPYLGIGPGVDGTPLGGDTSPPTSLPPDQAPLPQPYQPQYIVPTRFNTNSSQATLAQVQPIQTNELILQSKSNKTAYLQTPSGQIIVRSGDIGVRDANLGSVTVNLPISASSLAIGYDRVLGTDGRVRNFAVYSSTADALQAQRNLLLSSTYQNITIEKALNRYVNPVPPKYLDAVVGAANVVATAANAAAIAASPIPIAPNSLQILSTYRFFCCGG